MSAPLVQTLVAPPAVIAAMLDLQAAIVDQLQPVTPADTPALAPPGAIRMSHVTHQSVTCWHDQGDDSYYRAVASDVVRGQHPAHWIAHLTRRDQLGRSWHCIDPTPLVVDDFGFLVPVPVPGVVQ